MCLRGSTAVPPGTVSLPCAQMNPPAGARLDKMRVVEGGTIWARESRRGRRRGRRWGWALTGGAAQETVVDLTWRRQRAAGTRGRGGTRPKGACRVHPAHSEPALLSGRSLRPGAATCASSAAVACGTMFMSTRPELRPDGGPRGCAQGWQGRDGVHV